MTQFLENVSVWFSEIVIRFPEFPGCPKIFPCFLKMGPGFLKKYLLVFFLKEGHIFGKPGNISGNWETFSETFSGNQETFSGDWESF